MIEINLTPPQFRKKSKGSAFAGGLNIPFEIVIGVGGGLLMLLVLVHVYLFITNLGKIAEQQTLKGQFDKIATNKNVADGVLSDLRSAQAKLTAVEKLAGERKIYWSQKLNLVSDAIPKGIWLKKIALRDGIFFLEGSSFSKEKKEISNVHLFTSALKDSLDFQKYMNEFELGSIQSRTIQRVDIADFLITTKVDKLK